MTKTTKSLSASQISRDWYVIDASSNTLGRVATAVAEKLIGKQKPTYSPNIDNGDYVIVVNTDNLKVSGNKMRDKRYYRHSGYIGNLKEASLQSKVDKDSTEVIRLAVKGMLPKNKLQSPRLARLKLYAGEDHEHAAQKPQQIGEK